MADTEPFTLIEETSSSPGELFPCYRTLTSAHLADIDIQITASLRAKNPSLTLTSIPASNVNLLVFASSGHASATLDTTTDSIARWRGYIPARHRGGRGHLGDAVHFAKYHYQWAGEDFVLYAVGQGYDTIQYVLKEPRGEETVLGHSEITDALIEACGQWQTALGDFVYVYDNYWTRSEELFQQVQKASWDDVILDPDMKKELTQVSERFFDSKEVYEDFGVPWKRGIIFHGPVGNGKTISIKALMHTLYSRKDPIPSLYVKSAPQTFNIRAVFQQARAMTPCLLVFEDIDTVVTYATRSYFFNEVDGLENNDGILMVASTNHLDQLDPGLSKRPSRFDRKYLFPLPSTAERKAYCEFWRRKLKNKPNVEFPKTLCPAIASITEDFSFAYLQEAFVATLLVLAKKHLEQGNHGRSRENDDGDGDGDDLDEYELWRVMKEQVKILRDEMGSSDRISTGDKNAQSTPTPPVTAARPAGPQNPWTREAPIRSRRMHNLQSAGAGRMRGTHRASHTAQPGWAISALQQAERGVANGLCAGNRIPELESRSPPKRAETASDVMLGTWKAEDFNSASFQWKV